MTQRFSTAKILRMFESGMTRKQIAFELKVTYRHVCYILAENNLGLFKKRENLTKTTAVRISLESAKRIEILNKNNKIGTKKATIEMLLDFYDRNQL